MPRHFRFPAYPKKPHKTGQARLKIRGQDYYLGVWGSPGSRAEYARLAAEMAQAPPAAPPPRRPPAGVTVTVALARWLEAAAAERGPDNKELSDIWRALTVVKRLYGEEPAAAFDVARLRAVREAMIDGSWMTAEEKAFNRRRKLPVGWCRTHVNRSVVRVRTAWRWLEEVAALVPPGSWGHLRALRPLAKTRQNVRQTEPRRPAAWAQVEAALAFVPPAVGVMLQLQWWAGMRPGEVVAMRAGAVDRAGPAGAWLYRLDTDKNSWRGDGPPPPVVLGPECQRVLGPWLEASRARGADAYLFPPSRRRLHAHYTPAAYARAVERACKQHGIEHFTPYQIRHSAKERVTRECGLDAARCVLRQKSIEATNGYARQRDMKLAGEAARKTG